MSGDLMFGKETTYGTAVATSRAIEVSSDSLDATRGTSTVESTRWGSLAARRRNTINLAVKDLSVDGKTYRYFDYAKAVRQ